MDKQNCQLMGSANRLCDLLKGPPTPKYEDCTSDITTTTIATTTSNPMTTTTGIQPSTTQPLIASCRELTLDDCDEDVFGSLIIQLEGLDATETCEDFCRNSYKECRFFILDRTKNTCQLYKYNNNNEYLDTCKITGSSKEPKLKECMNTNDLCDVSLLLCSNSFHCIQPFLHVSEIYGRLLHL